MNVQEAVDVHGRRVDGRPVDVRCVDVKEPAADD